MSTNKITKAVIPCAGMGTRFLPITKSLPKEMLPIVDTPVLKYIVDEASKSGISDVLLINNRSKPAIEHFFKDKSFVDKLRDLGKHDEAELLATVNGNVEISFAYQDEPKGSGHAVLCAEKFVGKQAFALAWGDDLIESVKPVIGQLTALYDVYQVSVIGVQPIDTDEIVKYGVIQVGEQDGKIFKCNKIVEKPTLDKVPSRLAALGRYVLHPEIFEEIRATASLHAQGEMPLTSALNSLAQKSRLVAHSFEGTRFDMGDKFGSLTASIYFGRKRFGRELDDYLKKLLIADN